MNKCRRKSCSLVITFLQDTTKYLFQKVHTVFRKTQSALFQFMYIMLQLF